MEPVRARLPKQLARQSLKQGGRVSRTNRTDATTEAIKQFIIDNHMHPGDPLPGETKLCDALGVSRSSVREALRRLEALDIVNIRQGSGSFVGTLSLNPLVEALAFKATLSTQGDLKTLREVVDVRRYVDLGVGVKLCRQLKGTTQPGLKGLVNLMVEQAENGQTFYEADMAFHDGLLALAGNEVVRQLVNSLWRVHQTVIPRVGLAQHEGLLDAAHAHGAMLDAACAGDIRAFERAVADHYRPLAQAIEAASS